MKLHLDGHNYKYAVEQIMLALFPTEKPDYSTDSILCSLELIAESSLRFSPSYAQAVTLIRCGDRVSRGVARVRRDRLTGKLISDRLLQRIIKQSFYRASLAYIAAPPVWGSLTGIRPAHIASAAIRSGFSEKAAAKKLTGEFYVSHERAAMTVDAAKSSLALKSKLTPNDIALYVGIPFCPTRCAYCSFVSNSVEKSFGLVEPFVRALKSEIKAAAEMTRALGLRIVTVYIGGGTPTALPAEALEVIMQALDSSFDLSHLMEYTVEAGRPDTITARKLDVLYRFGVNRVCVNPQSMSSEVLEAIGRKHTPGDVFEAVSLVRRCGAMQERACQQALYNGEAQGGATQERAMQEYAMQEHIMQEHIMQEHVMQERVMHGGAAQGMTRGMALNMDIIAGLPGDSPDSFNNTLDTVLDFKPENITVHTLSLKKGSRIMLEGTAIPDGANVGRMLDFAARRLRESGYQPYYLYRQKFTSGGYENTGWCKPGYECIYNICMMEELCTVLALGGGGVTKLVSQDGMIRRVFNAKYPNEYILKTEKIAAKFCAIEKFYANCATDCHNTEAARKYEDGTT